MGSVDGICRIIYDSVSKPNRQIIDFEGNSPFQVKNIKILGYNQFLQISWIETEKKKKKTK